LVGCALWGYVGIEGNYLTGTILHNALIATPPTQPVTVYILDAGTDTSMIQASYNGQPVTISREFLPSEGVLFGYNKLDLNLSLGF
jgi:hypothetical protein